MGSSASFGSKKRPAGKVYRTYGPLARLVTDIYNDVDAGFSNLEASVNAGWPSVRLVFDTAAAHNFSGMTNSVDNVNVVAGDRILVTKHTAEYLNGIYVVDSVGTGADGVWSRAEDLSSASQIQLGDSVWVTAGDVYKNTAWRVTDLTGLVWGSAGKITFTQQATTAGAVLLSSYTAANVILRGSGAGAVAGVTVGASTIVGRGAAGNVAALTASQTRTVLATTSAADSAELLGAGTVGADRLAAGSATEGVNGGDVKFTAVQAAGALADCTVPVVLALAIPDVSGNTDFTGLVGKHKVIDFWAVTTVGGAANTYQLATGADVAVTDAVSTAAGAGAAKHAAVISPTTGIFANGSTLRVKSTKTAGSAEATCYVLLVPVA